MSLCPGSLVPIYQAESAVLLTTAQTALQLLILHFTGSGSLLHLLSGSCAFPRILEEEPAIGLPGINGWAGFWSFFFVCLVFCLFCLFCFEYCLYI